MILKIDRLTDHLPLKFDSYGHVVKEAVYRCIGFYIGSIQIMIGRRTAVIEYPSDPRSLRR